MSKVAIFCLVDPNSSRRAAISYRMASSGIHVEPFESPADFPGNLRLCNLLLFFEGDYPIQEMIERFVDSRTWAPIVAYSETPTPRQIVRAIREGAVDYLVWPFLAGEVAAILDQPDSDLIGFADFRQRNILARRQIDKLTRREREVLVCVGTGLSNRQIGNKLEISPRTVEIHRSNMLRKLGAEHSFQAIRIAMEASILPCGSLA